MQRANHTPLRILPQHNHEPKHINNNYKNKIEKKRIPTKRNIINEGTKVIPNKRLQDKISSSKHRNNHKGQYRISKLKHKSD
uniref:Uncharacterized protein n=1 Tax=Rhizophora mucronata TaxID=61149 RepID=A0A2P2NIT4_RHIMU